MDVSVLTTLRLDPAVAPARWEHMVRRITLAAEPELARRAELARAPVSIAPAPDLLATITRYAAPALAAAAAIALITGSLAATAARHAVPRSAMVASDVSTDFSVTGALRGSDSATAWLVAGRAPSTDDLVRAAGLEDPTP